MAASKDKRSGAQRIRPVGAFVTVALAVGALTFAACGGGTSSTTSGTSSTTSGTSGTGSAACKAALTQFSTWLTGDAAAGVAEGKAEADWTTYHNSSPTLPSPSSPELNAAINQYNVDHQQGQALRQTANQDLARYQATVKTCTQSTLPSACKEAFAQQQTLIGLAARHDQAQAAIGQSTIAQQNAYRAGDVSAVNSATQSKNASKSEHNAAIDAWNAAIPAAKAATASCVSAVG